MTKNVIIVELNEFNAELLQLATSTLFLPAIKKVLSLPCSHYDTQDTEQSGMLEPWVQWVSVHTGLPSSIHTIKHLGDVLHLRFKQCWEILGENQITTGMWGVMNAALNHAPNVCFFLPDPWTFSENAAPSELNALLDLPRYLSKNYQNLQIGMILKLALRLIGFLFKSKFLKEICFESLKLFVNIVRFPKKAFVFICYFDYLSTLFFIQYKKRFQPQCSFLFLNFLAHLQHHHWRKGPDVISPELKVGLNNLNKILTLLFKHFPHDAFIMHNSLSQMNTAHETPWVLYRQKDPKQFFDLLKNRPIQIEQNMTHDGHAFFHSEKDCQNAYHSLKNTKILNQPLFEVEYNFSHPKKIFYQLCFTSKLSDPSVEFTLDNKNYRFFDYFDYIVTRTGRHIAQGTLYSDTIVFPKQFKNHEFNSYLYAYFIPKDVDTLKRHSDILDFATE